jgi:phage tail-like protein
VATAPTGSYLDYLPGIFVEADRKGTLEQLVAAFEEVLSGGSDALVVDDAGEVAGAGLEEILDGIADTVSGEVGLAGVERYFEPGPDAVPALRAPDRFLEWLSSWVALALRADLEPARQRRFIANAVSLYGRRGTKSGLEDLIKVYTDSAVTINELLAPLQIGVHSTIGVDTLIGAGAPHFFEVLIRLPRVDEEERLEQSRIVSAIIDAEKPAHTHYVLRVQTPTFQIFVHSTVGVDTLIGEPPTDFPAPP